MKRKNIRVDTIDEGAIIRHDRRLAEDVRITEEPINSAVDEYGLGKVDCGHNFLTNGMGIRGRIGNHYLLLYIAKGHEDLYMEQSDEWVNAPAGSFIIYKPHQDFSRVYTGTGVTENYYTHCIANKIFFAKIPFEVSKIYKTEPSAEIENYFENIISEDYNGQLFNDEFKKTLFLQLMITLYRKTHNIPENVNEKQDIEHAVFIMMRDYNINYSLEDFANMCNMSKYHFSRLFKKKMHMTPIAYRNQIRIKRAMEFLSKSSMSIGTISESIGFESLVYFCEAFKKTVGISPAQYRAIAQKKNKKSIDK